MATVALALAANTVPAQAADRQLACAPVIAIACGLADPVIDTAGDAAGAVIGAGAKVAGNTVLDGMAAWVGEGASWVVRRIARLVDRSTRPDLAAAWFSDQYRGMLSVALLCALAFLLIAIAGAALRQDPAAAVHAALVALPIAVICCFAAVTFVELALTATDEATKLLTAKTAGDSQDFFVGLAKATSPDVATPMMPGFLAVLVGVLAALLSIVVWIELILREAAIYLAVAFLPLSLSAVVWRRTAHLARRLAEGLVALILSKLTIATAVSFAASALAHGGSGGGVTTVLGGCAVLFLAALSPWALLRLIPLAGEQTGFHRGSVKQAIGTAPGARTASSVVRTGMVAGFAPAAAVSAPAAAAGTAQMFRPRATATTPLKLGPSLGSGPERPQAPKERDHA